MPSAIQVSHLNQGYGNTAVLSDISLTVETGTILGLIGPSIVPGKPRWSIR